MIGGATAVANSSDLIKRRSRSGMIDVMFGGALPTDTMTNNGDGTYTLTPSYWLNNAKPTAAQRLSYTGVMHAATGTPNGKLIIWCPGHESNDGAGYTTEINNVLAQFNSTYDVFEVFLLGMGTSVTQYNTPLVLSDVDGHARMLALPDDMMRLHLWHYVAAVNTFINSYSNVYTVGFSGGGQMALLMGAIDTRLAACFPMAWGQPDWIVEHAGGSVGDAEQQYGPLLAVASRLGWLALASEKFCHTFHDVQDTVFPFSVANGAILQAQIRTIASNYTETVTTPGDATHTVRAAWLTAIAADLAAL